MFGILSDTLKTATLRNRHLERDTPGDGTPRFRYRHELEDELRRNGYVSFRRLPF
jgi:hypothetical protein